MTISSTRRSVPRARPPEKVAPIKTHPERNRMLGLVLAKNSDAKTSFFQAEIQACAVSALQATSSRCFHLMSDKWQSTKVVDKYVKAVLGDPNPAAKRGFALALGSLHSQLLCKHLDQVRFLNPGVWGLNTHCFNTTSISDVYARVAPR